MTLKPSSLPATIPMITMWGDWADQLCNGHKTIETRSWQWTHGNLAVIHCGLKDDDHNVIPVQNRSPFGPVAWRATRGSLCALVWICESFPLLPEHCAESLIYAPGLYGIRVEILALLRGPKRRGARGRPIQIPGAEVEQALQIVL